MFVLVLSVTVAAHAEETNRVNAIIAIVTTVLRAHKHRHRSRQTRRCDGWKGRVLFEVSRQKNWFEDYPVRLWLSEQQHIKLNLWRKDFRMSYPAFLSLCDELNPYLQPCDAARGPMLAGV